MICPFCGYRHTNEGDKYGCPNCEGNYLGMTKKPRIVIQVRLDADLKEKAEAEAERRGVNLSKMIRDYLRRVSK